ncbi:enoyl-CoA hydratase/isomerase family protein [Enemella sp. A6]|uniref:enoyl-CoA hydratase/isomerase family protein n=1 Tax=Enemella sp. A6 TaxID=3440152 RepID=UPI003EBE33DA
MSDDRIATWFEDNGRVMHLRLENPAKHNAIDAEMCRALGTAWKAFEDSEARVAVISGDGPSFSSGADLGNPPTSQDCLPGVTTPVTKPVISAVHGWCIGLGLVLSQMADLCVADAGAQFELPELRLGQTGGAVLHLTGRIPLKGLFELLYGERVDAERAQQLGLVYRVVPPGTHLAKAREVAGRLADLDSTTVRWIKPRLLATLPQVAGADAVNLLDHIRATDPPTGTP